MVWIPAGILIALFLYGIYGTFKLVGKPRDPISAEFAVAYLLFTVIVVALIVVVALL